MPAIEYRILLTAIFNNQADRDAWCEKIKAYWRELGKDLNPPKAAHITPQEYFVSTDGKPEELG